MADQAFMDVSSGEIRETSRLEGEIGFQYAAGEGTFVVSQVAVDLVYTAAQVRQWTVHIPVEPFALADLAPLAASLGTAEEELLEVPPDKQMELVLTAKPEVLARLSPELTKLSRLSAMFQVESNALLNLDNYENGICQTIATAEAIT